MVRGNIISKCNQTMVFSLIPIMKSCWRFSASWQRSKIFAWWLTNRHGCKRTLFSLSSTQQKRLNSFYEPAKPLISQFMANASMQLFLKKGYINLDYADKRMSSVPMGTTSIHFIHMIQDITLETIVKTYICSRFNNRTSRPNNSNS